MDVRILGSGGFAPNDRRETAAALLRKGDDALLVDAGTGVRRLLTERELLAGVARLRVVLTHFHLDHTIGLLYVADVEPEVELWGAGTALEGVSTRALLERLLGPPFAPASFLGGFAGVHEVDVDGKAAIGSFAVQMRIQPLHSNPTLALRVDDQVVWCTDTAYDEDNVGFARGAALLAHEAFHPGESTDDPGHTAAGEAGRVAAAAGVGRLLLIHVNPEVTDDDALAASARTYFRPVEVAHDATVARVDS
jgi:ribonuclease BN (tRNA processing enzyme)